MFLQRCYAISRSAVVLLYFVGTTSLLFAQDGIRTLDRNLEPVVIRGFTFPEFIGTAINDQENDLFLYAYRASTQSWQQISFQFDEVGEKVNDSGVTETSFFFPDDGLLDENDELVFMAKDAGDQTNTWIDDANSKSFSRFELRVTDPLDATKQGWVYLYKSTTLTLDPNLTDYVDYFPSMTTNVGEDTVRSKFYEMAHYTNGFPKDLIIPQSAGGSGEDILDIIKFRSDAKLVISVKINEENIMFLESESDSVRAKDGLVRVIKELEATLRIDLGILGSLNLAFSTPPAFYFPYSASIDIAIPELQGASVSNGRISVDLNANATNMIFTSANNPAPGFTIDGIPESSGPVRTIDDQLPNNNWIQIVGTQGTIVHLFPLADTVGGARELYYADDASDVGGDTGDKMSFGDSGILITNGITPPFTLKYKGYFLASSQPSDIGAQVANFERNPLQVVAISQSEPVPVELASFTGTVENNDVHLVWVTATETNNFGFDVERRSQSIGEWTKIAFLKGRGTTAVPAHYEYFDRNLRPGSYDYRLKQIDVGGAFDYSGVVTAVVGVPQAFALHQNYPNPFNPSTEIQYQIATRPDQNGVKKQTTLKIYNLLGEEVQTLVDKEQAPGFYTVRWDGTDRNGRHVTSGVYLYRLQSGAFVATKKMILVQ
ncbi:MAG: FlgD immunoglobulin-like domain containing protein [bacterium]